MVVPGGTTILPNGRFLTPKGRRLWTGEDLWNLTVSPDGATLVGFNDGGLTIYRDGGSKPTERTFHRLKEFSPDGLFTRDGKSLIISTGDEGGIAVLDAATLAVQKTISANINGVKDTYLNDLVLSPDGKTVYAADVAIGRIVIINLARGAVVGQAKAGRQPYAVALSEDGKNLFVANIGMFDYSVIPPPAQGQGDVRGISKPAFGFPSPEALAGRDMEGRRVPGLGSPYAPDAQSIDQFDVRQPEAPRRLRTAKAGILIHAPADGGKSVGGSAPCALLVRGNRLFVANANNDTVQVFDTVTLKPQTTWRLSPSPLVNRLRGVIPSALLMDAKGKRLYVAESGLNSVAVLDAATGKTVGRIPTGWFPTALRWQPGQANLLIATQKGLGRGPQGALHRRPTTDERYGLANMPGMIDAVTVPNDATLAQWEREVRLNNGIVNVRKQIPAHRSKVVPSVPGKQSAEIKYVVFITKENHTFDGIFGGLKGTTGEPAYAHFGMNGWIAANGKDQRLPIMPNHIRLAEQFGISDNFYMEPQASGDGHRWLVGVYPSLWTTRVFYAGWDFRLNNAAPGRLTSFGSDGSQIPEDYLENGSLWEHLARGNVPFRNYGEGYEMPNSDEGWMLNKAGTYYQVNHPMPKVLFDNTCFNFPAYNNNIPDIARADWFVEDLEQNFLSKGKPLPKFLNIAICNDHGAGPMPARGYPYTESFMADNDLALGRIVQWLSHRPEWKNMAIFVTQDDSGGDDDSVDRHRSFVLNIGPYAKRGFVAHQHTSIMSILKTIYRIHGLGANNMFDALTTDLAEMFTDKPDFTPYVHVPTDPRVFKPENTFDPTDPKFERRRGERPFVRMDDPDYIEHLRKEGVTKNGKDEDDE